MIFDITSVTSYLTSLQLPIHHISQPDVLEIALTHKSYAADHVGNYPHNERLEFLGDSVVGVIINHLLYNNYPLESESNLTLYKISLVRQDTLALVARNIKLDQQILIGNGEERKGGRNNDAILCDCFEALVGWIYLDLGWNVAYSFVEQYVYNIKDTIYLGPTKSYKSLIQEHIQSQYKILPEYRDREYSRNDARNEVMYESSIYVHESIIGVGLGSSKRKAQEEAAKIAYEKMIKA